MIPLRDTIPARTFPVVTIGLIVVNVLVFVYEASLGTQVKYFVMHHGLVPVRYFWLAEHRPGELVARYGPVLTSMFLHGGFLHLAGNMLFLWIFGDNVEDRLGRARFLAFYLACGVVAALGQTHLFAQSQVPMVGASGAIAGVLGAYLLFYPHSRVLTLVPVFLFLHVIEVPAFFFLGIWFLMQALNASASLGADVATGGVAWLAHVGGFVAGVVLGPALARRAERKRKTYPTREVFHPW